MIFKVVRSKYSLKVCKLIKVYKGAFRLENSLDVNIFDYNKSWDNLVGDDKVITVAELILVKFFPLSICKKLTKNFILLNRNNFDEYSGYDDFVDKKQSKYEVHNAYESNPKALQFIDIPLEDLLYDVKDLTRNNYIVQKSLLELNK